MGAFNQALKDAGMFVDAAGLRASPKGARVAFSGQDREVTKGPFPNIPELVAGYWIWKVGTSTRRSSGSNGVPTHAGPSVIEIRAMYEMDDFERSTTTDRIAGQARPLSGESHDRPLNGALPPGTNDEGG